MLFYLITARSVFHDYQITDRVMGYLQAQLFNLNFQNDSLMMNMRSASNHLFQTKFPLKNDFRHQPKTLSQHWTFNTTSLGSILTYISMETSQHSFSQ